MRAFLKAVSIGALAGAALPLLATVPLALVNVAQPMSGHRDILGSLWFAALPLTISFAIVLTCATVIELPTHLALRKSNVASQEAYVFVGGASGIAVTLVFVLLIKSDSYWLAVLGGVSGATTGWSWWKEISGAS